MGSKQRSTFVTPGVILLIRLAVNVGFPSLFVYVLLRRLRTYYAPHVPDFALILTTILALPCFFAARIIYSEWYKRRRAAALGARLVDTPGGWPGNLSSTLSVIKQIEAGYPGDAMKSTMEIYKHGNIFNRRPLFEDMITTTEPHHIKAILSTDFTNFVKGDVFQSSCRSVLGHGVFNADGDMWKQVFFSWLCSAFQQLIATLRFHRSMTRPFFNRDRISDFEIFDRHADEIIRLMQARLKEGYAVDFEDAVARFTLDSATEYLFGSSVHSMSTGIPYPHHAPKYLARRPDVEMTVHGNPTADAFARSFLNAQEQISKRLRFGWIWRLMEIGKDQTQDAMSVVNGFVEPIVKGAVEKKKKKKIEVVDNLPPSEKELGEGETLLDHLMKYTDDEKLLKEETINILIAGRDTTASTLTFMFFFLATHPQVVARLRAEVMEHVGPSRMPVYEDIKNMRYLRAVINETLRLYPAVPLNSRCSINETTFPSSVPGEKPYYIPPKTRILYSVFLMHRRTDLWGPDAEEFDPDRFLDERVKKYILPNNFIFLPFNAGPRICLGQQFAYNEMSFITVRLLQRFSSFVLDRSSQPPDSLPPVEWAQDPGRKGRDGLRPKTHLTMYNQGGLWMKMEEISNVAADCS